MIGNLFLLFVLVPICTATYDYTVKRLNITYRFTFGNLLYKIVKICRFCWEQLGSLVAYVSSFLYKIRKILHKLLKKLLNLLEKLSKNLKIIILGILGEMNIQGTYFWEIMMSWVYFFKSYLVWARANAGVKTVVTGSVILICLICIGTYSLLTWYGLIDEINETLINISGLSFVRNKTIANGTIVNGTIANGTIVNGTIANGTITNETIANETITNGTTEL